MNCAQPMELIRRKHLSAAIFAPGWINEAFKERNCIFKDSLKFWNLMLKFLYTPRCIEKKFSTTFKTGIDYKNKWFSLNEPQILPIIPAELDNNVLLSKHGLEMLSMKEAK